jgi:hypothetical protein
MSLTASFSRFQHFLSSAIHVNTQDFDNKLYQNHNIVLRDRGELFFTDCVFDTCVSNSAGGAIQLYADTLNGSDLCLVRCFFQACTANMHGGAVYALVAHFAVIDSCFAWCSARDRQAALLRGESVPFHPINQSVICFCGRGVNDRTTFSTSSSTVFVNTLNLTFNNVAQWAAGHYLESNRMATMRFSTFSNNIGVNILNLQLRNHESDLESVNFVNNSASLSWKTLIYANANVNFVHFYFVMNSKPFLITDKVAEAAVFVDCVFDVPFDDKLFSGSFSYTQCLFDVEAVSLPVFATFRKDVCVNQFAVKDEEGSSDTLIWWLLAVVVCGVAGYLFFFGSPKPRDEEERVPFRRGARRLMD